MIVGKHVLDFASGSGLVAIAAAKSGAANVQACDIDAFAIEAIALNAESNDVKVSATQDDLISCDAGWDVVLAGDVSYERDMAKKVTNWLHALHLRGAKVLIGDPGRSYLARTQLTLLEEYQVPVTRDLEDMEIKKTGVWGFGIDGAIA